MSFQNFKNLSSLKRLYSVLESEIFEWKQKEKLCLFVYLIKFVKNSFVCYSRLLVLILCPPQEFSTADVDGNKEIDLYQR